ncbi:MAG TPA: hypothetical protein VJ801_10880, partial [Polyangia bacterium]|nr:hypothetical protein [Polyangia bacterium]
MSFVWACPCPSSWRSRSRGAGTQAAQGDTFAACPPTQTAVANCGAAPPAYTDVAYFPAVAGDPV